MTVGISGMYPAGNKTVKNYFNSLVEPTSLEHGISITKGIIALIIGVGIAIVQWGSFTR